MQRKEKCGTLVGRNKRTAKWSCPRARWPRRGAASRRTGQDTRKRSSIASWLPRPPGPPFPPGPRRSPQVAVVAKPCSRFGTAIILFIRSSADWDQNHKTGRNDRVLVDSGWTSTLISSLPAIQYLQIIPSYKNLVKASLRRTCLRKLGKKTWFQTSLKAQNYIFLITNAEQCYFINQ